MTETRTPLAAATAGIRQAMLAGAAREDGEAVGACRDCRTPDGWCACERMARAALDGLFAAYYEVRESR